MKIGILAVQGDFEAHGKMLERMGVDYVYVSTPEDLSGVQGVILPGGESTAQLRFLKEEGLKDALLKFAREGGAFFGTCAGAILLAEKVENPPQESLGIADLVVMRNAYGRQLASEVIQGSCTLKQEALEMVFIRAPVIEKVGEGWEVLAERNGRPVLVRKGRTLVATFHPELTDDATVHRYFVKLVQNGA